MLFEIYILNFYWQQPKPCPFAFFELIGVKAMDDGRLKN